MPYKVMSSIQPFNYLDNYIVKISYNAFYFVTFIQV